ncbi:MAG: hypothetical protein JXR88_00805 [Clostridia bacterium]|nr:hypothetical protein [Clostridia bacterium]
MSKYSDMIHMPHHVSKTRPRMKTIDRAAQFAPFAAMVGHAAAVQETARYTESKKILTETEMAVIDQELQDLESLLPGPVAVEVVYFEADLLKAGGKYIRYKGEVKKIDAYNKKIIFMDDYELEIECIAEIAIVGKESSF